MMEKKTCFVTVGTTKFEALIEAMDSDPVLEALESRGFSRVLVQFGNGIYEPFAKKQRNTSLSLEAYRFKPSLQTDMKEASLVITHAGKKQKERKHSSSLGPCQRFFFFFFFFFSGYGCLMESLTLQKDVIAVINDTLMDNHQVEIGRELSRKKHAVMCVPTTLAETVRSTDFKDKILLPPANPKGYVDYIGEMLGVCDE